MRAPWLTAFAVLALCAGAAYGQAFQYVARTAAPVARSGAVTAGSLTWQCTASECRISGPWPVPGVPACAALAAQVGRITSYGRTGAMLTADQLAQCNANVAGPIVQLDPRLTTQVRPQTPLPSGALPAPLGSAPAATASTAAPTSQVAIEPGGRPEDIVVHVLSTPAIRFYGVTPRAAAPVPPPPTSAIVSGRIESPGVRLQASAPGATPTSRSATLSEAPVYARGVRSDVVLRVPVSLRDMPAETQGVILECHLFISRFVPFIDRPRLTSEPGEGPTVAEPVAPWGDFFWRGARSADHQVAFGGAYAYMRTVNRFEATFDVPLQLRPFYRLEDARSYQCDVSIRTARSGGSTVTVLSTLAGASGPAGFRPAAGSTPLLTVEGNIQ